MSSTVAEIVERAKAQARREAQERGELALRSAQLLESLPELMERTRISRGLTRSAAARQVGINEKTWESYAYGTRGGQVGKAVKILRWLGSP